ncbi:hypothetical protein EVAR_23836_1 [Eumeta japonica]|uniref:Uncharacterized protein n=1 Tax=Eumeta variegata TaxID=151549 RepID=A0A4C1VNY5_EUMVA|nr:hypothetical protein EVAR_23836_1 [Eumeta japonica]
MRSTTVFPTECRRAKSTSYVIRVGEPSTAVAPPSPLARGTERVAQFTPIAPRPRRTCTKCKINKPPADGTYDVAVVAKRVE